MGRLAGKVAIVTGGARGTGEQTARLFVEEGARVVIGDVLEEEGRATANDLGDAGRFVRLDVTDPASWQQCVEQTEAQYGAPTVLINNAGLLHMQSLLDIDPARYEQLWRVNLMGPFLGIQAVARSMEGAGGGSIVNVSSIDGLVGMNGVTTYATSKFGVRGLAKSAALELGRSGIRVNSVCPAGGNPEMYGPWMRQLAGFMEQTQAYNDNRGIPGTVSFEAIANAVLYLASDASAGITGIDLPVDGGATAGKFIEGFNSL